MMNYTGSAIVAGAVVNVTALASIDWAIPAGVRRITFVADQVVIPANSLLRFAVSGSFVTTGYVSNLVYLGLSYGTNAPSTSGLQVPYTLSAQSATVTLVRVGTSNTWLSKGTTMYDTNLVVFSAGRVALAGEATSIRFLPPSGNFTAGGIVQIMWEF